ncbi:carbohydrate ABC transporter permease [Enterococcus casseliflavus]|uniref:carbohydrate ABC transporter permease n=1 Tax=Enterococcus TaxID=1350 RepID=UPI0039A5A0BD
MENVYTIKEKFFTAERVKRAFFLLPGIVFALFQLFPLIWLFNFSLVSSSELFGSSILVWPSEFRWENYQIAWVDGKIIQYLMNSLIVNIVTVLLTIFLSFMMAYAFTRMKWKLKNKFLLFIMLGIMIPIHATLVPNFISFDYLGIKDSYLALILPYTAFSIPQAVFIYTGYLSSVPLALEEAAVLDGCSLPQAIFRIVFPIVKAPTMTVAIMTFLSTWNEYIMAATYLSSDSYRTLPFSVQNFVGQYSSNYSAQFAVMFLSSLPAIIVYIVLNDKITKGAAMGAVK